MLEFLELRFGKPEFISIEPGLVTILVDFPSLFLGEASDIISKALYDMSILSSRQMESIASSYLSSHLCFKLPLILASESTWFFF